MWAAVAVLRMLLSPPLAAFFVVAGVIAPAGHHDGRCWQRQGSRVRWLCTLFSNGTPGAATSERHVRF